MSETRGILPMVAPSSLMAGFFSGACGTLVGHPLDTIKVRVQLGLGVTANAAPSLPNSTHRAATKGVPQRAMSSAAAPALPVLSLANLRSLYRGLLPPLLTSGTMNSINFAIYEMNRTWLYEKYGLPSDSPRNVFFASAGAGLCISTVTAPISLVKVQRQSNVTAQGDPRTYWSMIREIKATHGAAGFYRGFLPMLYMESVGRGFYMYVYFCCKPFFAEYVCGDVGMVESTPARVMSAATAGCASWVAVYPVDVVKSKLQADAVGERYRGAMDCIEQTFRDGGARAFTRGIGYTIIRAAPTAATVLPVYEHVKDFLVKNYNI